MQLFGRYSGVAVITISVTICWAPFSGICLCLQNKKFTADPLNPSLHMFTNCNRPMVALEK